MKRYIDADALIAEMERCSYETWSKGVNPTWWAQAVKVKDNIIKCIERQPTVDVVEVVRCKDCNRRQLDAFGRVVCIRSGQMIEIKDTDYCSYGERRGENEG